MVGVLLLFVVLVLIFGMRPVLAAVLKVAIVVSVFVGVVLLIASGVLTEPFKKPPPPCTPVAWAPNADMFDQFDKDQELEKAGLPRSCPPK